MITKESFKGIFFLPNLPENEIAGELKFDYEENIRLELYGSFSKIEDINSVRKREAIWGYLFNGEKISLINCNSTNWTATFGAYATEIYNAEIIFKGIHIDNLEENKFNELYAEFDYLYDWLNISGIKTKYDKDFDSI